MAGSNVTIEILGGVRDDVGGLRAGANARREPRASRRDAPVGGVESK